MSLATKYSKYIVITLIVIIGAYGIYVFILNPSEQQGVAMTFTDPKKVSRTVYDDSLPNDLNYTWLLGTSGSFMIPVNASEYAKSSTPEQTVLEFNTTQSIKAWLDTAKMPNLIRNTIKLLIDSDKYKARSLSWGAGNTADYISYLIKETMSPAGDTELIIRQQIGWGEVNASIIWELVIVKPLIGNNYEVTFTRMPKP